MSSTRSKLHRTAKPPHALAAVTGVRLPMVLRYFHWYLLVLISALAWSGTVSSANAENADFIQNWRVSESLSIQEILPGIWVHTSWRKLKNGVYFPANGLLVRYDDELILVDTAWGADLTAELLGWVDSEIGLPITVAIVTHFHYDSMGGMPALKAHDIPILGSTLTRKLAENEGIERPDVISGLDVGSTVTIGNVEVFFPGAGHSEDSAVVWVPEVKVLFGGCGVRSPDFPGLGNTEDANLKNWPKAIRSIQEKYPTAKFVVPGHGSVGDAALLSYTGGLFEN